MTWLTDLLKEIPLSAVLKERVALAEQKFKDMEAETKGLKELVTELRQQNERLAAQLEVYVTKEKSKPTLEGQFYKFAGEEGHFCMTCYDTKGEKVRTASPIPHVRKCPICKTIYGR